MLNVIRNPGDKVHRGLQHQQTSRCTTVANRILRFPQVMEATGLSRSTIYNRLNPKHKNYDASFPRPAALGPRLVGWKEISIDQWIDETIKAGRQVPNQ